MKIILDTQTQKLINWPRVDNESVVGLSDHLIEMELIQDPVPHYNPYTQKLIKNQTINFDAKSINITYNVEDLETPFSLIPNNNFIEPPIPLI
jgi:hypothetical protein